MIRIGIVGVGFMGMIHYLAARKLKGARVAALCSRDPKKLAGDWRSIRGNFGPPGEMMDLGGGQEVRRARCAPGRPGHRPRGYLQSDRTCMRRRRWRLCGRASMSWSKSRSPWRPVEADAHGEGEPSRLASCSWWPMCCRSFPSSRTRPRQSAAEHYGKLLAAHFKRVISRPDWSADIADPRKTGGPAIDLHIHDTHFIGLLCGVPAKVFSSGVEEAGAVVYLTTQYLYGPGGPSVTCS